MGAVPPSVGDLPAAPFVGTALAPVPFPSATPLPERTPLACICKIFPVCTAVPTKTTREMQGGQSGGVPQEPSQASICGGGGVSLLLHLIVGSVGFSRSVHARVEAMCD